MNDLMIILLGALAVICAAVAGIIIAFVTVRFLQDSSQNIEPERQREKKEPKEAQEVDT